MESRNFSWSIELVLQEPPTRIEHIQLSSDENIKILNTNLLSSTKFTITSNGQFLNLFLVLFTSELEYYYDSFEHCSGSFYVYGSEYLKNYLGYHYYSCGSNGEDFLRFISNSTTISLYYIGEDIPYGYVQQVYRVAEENTSNNMVYSRPDNNKPTNIPNITASHGRNLLFSIILPVVESNPKTNPALMIDSVGYIGDGTVKVVTGYNETYTLFEFDEKNARYWTEVLVFDQSLSYKSLVFTADQMTIFGASNESWNGFLIRYEAIPKMNSGQKRSILWIIFLFVGVFLIV
uniref:Uncharacterized protein n=1 Tax=Acrobeloides nanus TaxID=290746 RepID=A0A914DUD1_9BILA